MTEEQIADLQARWVAFRDARDWRQYHSLRNLITTVNLEAKELLELTLWRTDAEVDALPQDPAMRTALADECADVLLGLFLVADKAGIDLHRAACEKIAKNELKYPVDKSYGSRKKYTEL
jgi:NTP pyrophosphatase (non-canonical NTP hydrolase)